MGLWLCPSHLDFDLVHARLSLDLGLKALEIHFVYREVNKKGHYKIILNKKKIKKINRWFDGLLFWLFRDHDMSPFVKQQYEISE